MDDAKRATLSFGARLALEAWESRLAIRNFVRNAVRVPVDVDEVMGRLYPKVLQLTADDLACVDDRRGYLFGIARWIAVDLAREQALKEGRHVAIEELDSEPDQDGSLEEQALRKEEDYPRDAQMARYENALASLPPLDRVIFEYRVRQERDRQWIADKLGVSVRVVQTRLQAVSRYLGKTLGPAERAN